ncbi:zinc dependent phospholipase C family protein [Desulfobacter curvatus]|uniref:zinc dependent phospholipase C family protein n=1 Tax=Desulfobacter curvatus TaxID=2290 RepID=UPI000377E92D|nr:zinc dependent phospholipase C family protein [Desulfobacter curvatus]
MKKIVLILIFTFIAVFGFTSVCLAWGPGIHMAIGNAILNNIELLPLAVARLLIMESTAFLYGCLSADIFIGKGSRPKPLHSHNWKTGLNLLDAADNPYLQAYSLGYLSHLAADIAAHNYYVPNLMNKTFKGGRLSHVYIEMLADSQVNHSAHQASTLFYHANREADISLRRQMEAKTFSFLIKKKLFHQTIKFLGYQAVSQSLEFSKKIVPAYHKDYLTSQIEYSCGLVVDLLQNPNQALALYFDPIGSESIALSTRENGWKKILKKKQIHPPWFRVDRKIKNIPLPLGAQHFLKQ